MNDHVGACGCQTVSDGTPNATRAPGDQGYTFDKHFLFHIGMVTVAQVNSQNTAKVCRVRLMESQSLGPE